MNITFLDASTMGDTPLDCIARLGDLTCWPTSTREEALERVADCEVLIINKVVVDCDLIDAAPSLRLICEAATGVNNIDLEYAAAKGIPVRNVAAYSTDSVVQQTFMHMLSLMGNAPYFDARVKDGTYSSMPVFTDVSMPFVEAAGKTIGIVGMGAIGSKAAAVDAGVIAGAALDVFCREPLPADSPLLHVAHPERFRFTPHTAWASVEARMRLAEGVAANIEMGF